MEYVSSYANKRYDQLQAEQAQRAANVVADFVQPDHATGEQPLVEDRQQQWVFTQVITVLQMDTLFFLKNRKRAKTEINKNNSQY
jgi:hypothetical protein